MPSTPLENSNNRRTPTPHPPKNFLTCECNVMMVDIKYLDTYCLTMDQCSERIADLHPGGNILSYVS